MKNRLISIVAGAFAGWLVVYIGESVLNGILPTSTDINLSDKAALKNYIQGLPAHYFVFLLLTWAFSSFLGGFVTGKFAKSNWKRACLTTGGILMIGNIANFIMIPHPIWVNIISVIMYLPLSYLGGKIINRRIENK
jgi:uncharacterized protein YacL